MNTSSSQHLEFLGDYGLWYYYLHTGDLESIAAVYAQTKTFLLETYQSGNPNTCMIATRL